MEDGIDALLNSARAARGTPLRELAEHLTSHPNALFTGDPRCPAALIRLTHILYETGYTAVARPGCAGCGKITTGLDPAPDGRLCPKCYARAAPRHPCARCGRMTRTIALRPEGGICSACYAKDSLVTEPCGQCGRRRRPATRAADGSARCQSCSSRPLRTCVTCGNLAPAQAITDTGPICKRCYRAPHRKCGGCGQVRRISKRATGGQPRSVFQLLPGTGGGLFSLREDPAQPPQRQRRDVLPHMPPPTSPGVLPLRSVTTRPCRLADRTRLSIVLPSRPLGPPAVRPVWEVEAADRHRWSRTGHLRNVRRREHRLQLPQMRTG
jgi:hypothetical protein